MSRLIKNTRSIPTEAPSLEKTDWGWIWGLFTLAIAFRLLYALVYRVNSDEPQHLHVVWGWAQGQIPYRDFFDNHTPLFHILCVPLFRWLGERADAVLMMRLLLFPLYLLSLFFVYQIACTVSSRRAARWATLFAALSTPLFLVTLEFRTDDLWTTLWLAAVAVLVAKPPSTTRFVCVGFLLGAAVATSMKTIFLLMVLVPTAAVVLFLTWRDGQRPSLGTLTCWVLATLFGFILIPGVLLAFFASQHALPQLLYCVGSHNTVAGATLEVWRIPVFIVMASIWVFAIRKVWVNRKPDEPVAPKLVITCANWLFLTILLGLWPSITSQDLPPWAPFFAIQAAAWIFFVPTHERSGWLAVADRARRSPKLICLCGIALLVAGIGYCQVPWIDRANTHVTMVDAVLRLTGPNDWVADHKGETIFRKRSTQYVLEKMTRIRFAKGLMKDDIAERIVATRTCVALPSKLFPDRAFAFLDANFIPVGPLSVVGKVLPPPGKDLDPITFDVAVPARYTAVTPNGPLHGTLDDIPFDGPRFLTVGKHTLSVERPTNEAVLLWADAVECGFSPFPLSRSAAHE